MFLPSLIIFEHPKSQHDRDAVAKTSFQHDGVEVIVSDYYHICDFFFIWGNLLKTCFPYNSQHVTSQIGPQIIVPLLTTIQHHSWMFSLKPTKFADNQYQSS